MCMNIMYINTQVLNASKIHDRLKIKHFKPFYYHKQVTLEEEGNSDVEEEEEEEMEEEASEKANE